MRILFKNAKIISMLEEKVLEKDIVVENGIIKEIGLIDDDDDFDRIIDVKNRYLLPGFIDSHVHLIPTCIDQFAVNLEHAKNIEEVLQMISAKRKEEPKIKFIIGSRLTEFKLKEKRLPTREEIDRVISDIPVFLSSIEFHTTIVNSLAMHKLKLPLSMEKIIRDSRGISTGELVNEASAIARKKMYEILPVSYMVEGLKKTYNDIIKQGITSLIAIEGGYLFHKRHVDFLLKNRINYLIDISILYSTVSVEKAKIYDFNKVGGDVFLDGSFRSRNAAVSEAYSDKKNEYGKLFFSDDELDDFIEQALLENLQISIHAVGDVGIDKLLDAYERCFEKYPNHKGRHKIEHFELPSKNAILRAKKLGLVLTMHPTYEYFFRESDGMNEKRLGHERALKTNPLREIFDNEIIVAGGSDSHVMPINPLLGIHAAVNHPNPKSRITPFEALKMFTINGAYGNFEDNIKGTIEEGKLADFVILADNPMTTNRKLIKDIVVIATIKEGKIIYSKDQDYENLY
jgi:predicted amidohydrolase YtcJ